MYNLRNHHRAPGMQIHAVPEADRAIDSSGRRLPWGYDYSVTANSENGERPPSEKGPFGSRSMRRSRSGASRSRSKTAEPRREEDRMKIENMAAEDAVFGSLRKTNAKEGGGDGKRDFMVDVDASAAGLGLETMRVTASASAAACETDTEPTEVLLYGFGEGMQWAAIEFYERVSTGCVLEDYERQPPGARYDISRSVGRIAAQKSLSRAAMRKKNRYAGGEHWIKITFESRQAAELALSRQPHIIKGYLVYAEPYHGLAPQRDEAVLATQAGAQITSETLPPTFATGNLNGSQNESETISSATATAPSTQYGRAHLLPWNAPLGGGTSEFSPSSSITINSTVGSGQVPSFAHATGFQTQIQRQDELAQPRRLRVEGAKRATVFPAELALAPKQPKSPWTAWIGASEMIGSAVPRKEDGAFDWDKASLYWRLFWWIDSFLGTDLCGLRGDD